MTVAAEEARRRAQARADSIVSDAERRAEQVRQEAGTLHEVSLTWDQLEGVLELKAFGAGPDARMLGVRLVTWSRDEPLIESVRGDLIQAVGRLAG